MKIAVVQHEIVWETPQANFEVIAPQIAEAAAGGAELITLTETFSWGFTLNTDRAWEAPDGPSTTFLLEQAAATGAWVVGSIPIRDADDDELPNNRMTFASPNGEIITYDAPSLQVQRRGQELPGRSRVQDHHDQWSPD